MQVNPKVHIVDDDSAIRDSLSMLMKSVGFESQTYASAEGFLEQAELESPGCLVVDVRMQGMSGLELQQLLNEKGIKLPVIIITIAYISPKRPRIPKSANTILRHWA